MVKTINCKEIRDTKIDGYREYTKNKDINLVILSVGNDYASGVYVKNKIKTCQDSGVGVSNILIEEDENTYTKLLTTIVELNKDNNVHGILLQLPINNLTNEEINTCLELIDNNKDVDCLTLYNDARIDNGTLLPCTVQAVIDIIEHSNINLEGKNVVVLGRSRLVGKPLSKILTILNANVTILHSKTNKDDFNFYLGNADIVISAVGKVKLFDSSILAKNKKVTVIDVGINRCEDKCIVGDFDASNVLDNITYTTVPGGVGVLTTTNVVGNLIKLYKERFDDSMNKSKVDEVLRTVGLPLTAANREAYMCSVQGLNGGHVDANDLRLFDDSYFNAILKSIGR